MSARELSLGEVCSLFLWTDKRTDITIPTGSLSDKSTAYVISEKVPSVLFQVKMMILSEKHKADMAPGMWAREKIEQLICNYSSIKVFL